MKVSRILLLVFTALLLIPSMTMAEKSSYLVILGSDDADTAVRCSTFVKLFNSAGRSVELFLMNDAAPFSVLANTEGIKSTSGDSLIDFMNYMTANKIPVCVCKPCAVARGVKEADMMPNAAFCTGGDLVAKTGEHAQIISCF